MSLTLDANLDSVRKAIGASAERAGRDPSAVTLVAVTKGFPVTTVQQALALGLRIFGENRVQEAIPKIEALGSTPARWHLIGHLQSNKVRFIEGRFTMVQSIDSRGIVEALGRRLNGPIDILIEVNVGQEPQKTGALANDVAAIAAAVARYGQLRLQGLMTIAPMVAEIEGVRPIFQKLRTLRDETSQRLGLPLPVLSMGMTDDYPVAVEEGATMLRLGRALFGPR